MKLPNSWKYQSLKDIIKDTQLGVNVKSSVDTVGIPLLKMGNLTIGDFNFNKLENTCELIENIENYYLKYGDFLFNTRNTPELVGKSAVWKWNDKKIIFNSNIMRINFIENIDSFFLGYYFSSKRGWNKLKLISTGTTSVGAIYTKDLLKVKIPLPPLEEQKKIADILSTVDKKIAFVEENINATEELKKGLMQKLLTEGIGHTEFKDSEPGRIPESWEIDILENHIQIISGQSPSNFDLEGQTYKFFKVNQLNFCAKYLFESEYAYDYSSYKNFNKGTIIFPKRGAAIFTNKVRILDTEGYIDTNLMGLVTKETINNEFLYYWLVSFELSNIADTSSIPQINNKHINPLKIAMPQLDEQILISDILINVDNKLEILKQKKQSFEELKKGLMQKLLTGEVRV